MINYRNNETRADNAVIPLGPNGDIAVFNGQPFGTAHLILDVNGYFQ